VSHLFRYETLEPRCLLSTVADLAYEWVHAATAANEESFFVYRDADSGFNHGFPSGKFAGSAGGSRPDLIDATVVDGACVDDPAAAGGCSSDPNRWDAVRGNVLRISFPPLSESEFAGLNIVEPEGYQSPGNPPGVQGYDLRGATRLLFDVRAPTMSGPLQVRYEVAGSTTSFVAVPQGAGFSSFCIDLINSPPSSGCVALSEPPNLAGVNTLLTIVTDAAHASQGGTLLLDNIRFEPVPIDPLQDQPRHSLPLGNATHGVVPAVIQARDDGDSTFAVTGSWTTVSSPNAYQGDQRVAAPGAAVASWTFTNLPPRNYVVEATWNGESGNATQAVYRIGDGADVVSSVSVDQTHVLAAPGDSSFDGRYWQRLGEAAIPVMSGTLVIDLSATGADGFVVADGVRIVPTIPPDQALRNLTTVYESSLAVFAFLDRGTAADLADARRIADALVYALNHDVSGPTALPRADDEAQSRGLRDSYSSGDLAWFNSKAGSGGPHAGEIRLAGFSTDARQCPDGFCLVLDGAYGGNNAFAIMALVKSYWQFDDVRYLQAALEIGNWIYGNLHDPHGPYFDSDPATQTYGGYFLGYPDQGVEKDRVGSLVQGKSIENNADIFAAFTMLASAQAERGQGEASREWIRRANIGGDYVMALYDPGDPADPGDGHFASGTLPSLQVAPGLEPDPATLRGGEYINRAPLLDSNTFTTLPLANSARYHTWIDTHGNPIDWREPLRFVIGKDDQGQDNFARQIVVASAGAEPFYGYSISQDPTASQFRPGGPIGGLPDGIAWEFTAQVAVMGAYLDALYGSSEFAGETQRILEQLQRAQIASPFGDGQGLVASTLEDPTGGGQPPLDQCLGTPFQCIAARPGLAATAWAIFADRGLNPFLPQHAAIAGNGEVLVIEDFNNKVTRFDLGSNYFGGNSGAVNLPAPTQLDDADCPNTDQITCTGLARDARGPSDDSLLIDFDFDRIEPRGDVGGIFTSLFGLTDTKIVFTPGETEPEKPMAFPGYSLDLHDLFAGSQWRPGRSAEWIEFDARLLTDDPVMLKIELTEELPPGAPSDQNPNRVFAYRTVSTAGWQTITLRLPRDESLGDFIWGDTAAFDPHRVSLAALMIERASEAVANPVAGQLLIDNLQLRDEDGSYPDLDLLRSLGSDPLPEGQARQLLELARASSFQYFVDFASPNEIPGLNNGGLVQDRSTFADLLTVGGAGFQLTAYAVAAERGLLDPADAALRVRHILELLDDAQLQGPDAFGKVGYQGFFYHFLGPDGRRKVNFDFEATAETNEGLNTVELSVIDTALAIAGVVTAGQYFGGGDPDLREMAERIYGRVNWPFMLHRADEDSADPAHNQFYLGWKPNETRDDDSGRWGRFKLTDADGLGQYSSKLDQGHERPATLDYYTDEALLVALLAMGSPNPAYRLGPDVWKAIVRDRGGETFVKTYPGSLFTYEFLSVWLATEYLGPDNHPMSMDLFQNTLAAMTATRQYTTANPAGRATWDGGDGATRWGLSATEGPFDLYFAEAAPTAALGTGGRSETQVLDAEGLSASGDGQVRARSTAYGGTSILLVDGQSRTFAVPVFDEGPYSFALRYSNDNFGASETITLSVDGSPIAAFSAADTGDFGAGWNQFVTTGELGYPTLTAGAHFVTVTVAGGDGYGLELDALIVGDSRPPENGTTTTYGAGSAIVHQPAWAIESLWDAFQTERLHPRVGFADAWNDDIADARPRLTDAGANPEILRAEGSWTQFTGFAIDHGPMLILIDNYLGNQFVPRQFTSHAGIQDALRQLFTPWHNRQRPLDVDNNLAIIPLDVLLVINDINHASSRELPVPPISPNIPTWYIDTNGDNKVEPIDVLLIINYLNTQAAGEGPEGELSAAQFAAGGDWSVAVSNWQPGSLGLPTPAPDGLPIRSSARAAFPAAHAHAVEEAIGRSAGDAAKMARRHAACPSAQDWGDEIDWDSLALDVAVAWTSPAGGVP
jgi:hypothetical protein